MADVPDVLHKIAPRNDSTKLSDRVVAEIERLILSDELREGEKLPTEAELCQAFGVSRSVIRDGHPAGPRSKGDHKGSAEAEQQCSVQQSR